MLIIQDVLVSDELIEENFICDLNACKGACCTEGDYGAPVDQSEMEVLKKYKDIIAQILPEKSREHLKTQDGVTFYKNPGIWGTSCHDDGACVFLTQNELGISVCGIEKTWQEGLIPFQKPISCHLYPVRVATNEIMGFEAWNYDRWDICSAACTKGNKEEVPLYRFVKDAIIRKKGTAFYDELEAAAQHLAVKKTI